MRPALLTICALLAAVAPAQSFDEYLKLRKASKITQAVGVAALETLIGARTVEVKGLVKGSMSSGQGHLILLEKTDGDHLMVKARNMPTWLSGNEVSVRLIVRASRESETDELAATLIGAATESQVADFERRQIKPQARPVKLNPVRNPRQDTPWNVAPNAAVPIYAAFIKQRNKRLNDATAWRIAEGVIAFSQKYGVDARLIMAMVMTESNFNPTAVSRAGAMGLGQLMPGTAQGMGVRDPFDMNQNLSATVRLIRGHMEKYQKKTGDSFEGLVLALAAYNAGSGAVRKHGGVPPYRETQNYIRKVTALYQQLCGN